MAPFWVEEILRLSGGFVLVVATATAFATAVFLSLCGDMEGEFARATFTFHKTLFKGFVGDEDFFVASGAIEDKVIFQMEVVVQIVVMVAMMWRMVV